MPGRAAVARRGRRSAPSLPHRAAFTLVEIMVAIGIIAVILSVSFPFMANQMRKDSMRQAVMDITEACRAARERAVLNGVMTEVRFQPATLTVSAVESSGSGPAFGAAAFNESGEPNVQHRGGGGTIFTVTLPKSVIIEFLGVNLIPDLQELEEVSASFYPNGTSDELVVVLRHGTEVRKITTEVVTGIPDVEVIR